MGILTRGSGGNELTLKPKRDIRLKLGFSDKGCVSCCYCDKLPPLNGLNNINDIQCYLELVKFRRSEGQNGSYWANVKVLTDMHSFLEALGENLFSYHFQTPHISGPEPLSSIFKATNDQSNAHTAIFLTLSFLLPSSPFKDPCDYTEITWMTRSFSF